MFHINKIHIEHLHLENDEKLNEILEAVNQSNNSDLERIIKQMKKIIKDVKSTPIK